MTGFDPPTTTSRSRSLTTAPHLHMVLQRNLYSDGFTQGLLFHSRRFLPLILQDLNIILFLHGVVYSESQLNAALRKQNILFYSESPQPPSPRTARDVSRLRIEK
jgi:hypothetical protein